MNMDRLITHLTNYHLVLHRRTFTFPTRFAIRAVPCKSTHNRSNQRWRMTLSMQLLATFITFNRVTFNRRLTAYPTTSRFFLFLCGIESFCICHIWSRRCDRLQVSGDLFLFRVSTAIFNHTIYINLIAFVTENNIRPSFILTDMN